MQKDLKKFEGDLQKAATSELERLKYELKSKGDASIEQLKSSLQQAATEHQVRFSTLHERRAQVIEEVYQRLIDVEKDYGLFVLVDGHETDEKKQREARERNNQAMYDMSVFIEKRRIYLPPDVCTSLKAFLDIMWNNAINVGVFGAIGGDVPTAETVKERREAFRVAGEALRKEIPSARAALEVEFRKLLGADG